MGRVYASQVERASGPLATIAICMQVEGRNQNKRQTPSSEDGDSFKFSCGFIYARLSVAALIYHAYLVVGRNAMY